MVLRVLAAVAAFLVCGPFVGSASAASGWAPTGSMSVAHRAAASVVLADGRVLVISGRATTPAEVTQSELYDPATGTWTMAAPNLVPRFYATATLLSDGRVLLAGGIAGSGPVQSSELYDPATNTWTATGSQATARSGHVAARLDDGKVLVAGGSPASRTSTATAEVYDPTTGVWSTTGPMSAARENPQATRLPNGRVLVAGGYDQTGSLTFHATADVYDPTSGTWTPTGSLAGPRAQGATALLANGDVLVAGGVNRTGFISSTERYRPATGTWITGLATVPTGNVTSAVRLEGGSVMVTTDGSTSTPLIDSVADVVDSTLSLGSAPRLMPTFLRLADGRVLIAGGLNLKSAELYTPPTTRGPGQASLGEVTVGASAERDVAVTNTGAERLRIAGVQLAGPNAADLTIAADGCSGVLVPAQGACTVRVRFAPSAEGARTAELRFDDNVAGSQPLALTGTGTPPQPVSSPQDQPAVTPPQDQPAVTPPAVAPKPEPSSRLPCSSRRRIVVSLRLPRSAKVRSGTVTLNGKRLLRLRSTDRSAVVDLRRRPLGIYVVRVQLRTATGKAIAFTKRFRTCAGRRP